MKSCQDNEPKYSVGTVVFNHMTECYGRILSWDSRENVYVIEDFCDKVSAEWDVGAIHTPDFAERSNYNCLDCKNTLEYLNYVIDGELDE